MACLLCSPPALRSTLSLSAGLLPAVRPRPLPWGIRPRPIASHPQGTTTCSRAAARPSRQQGTATRRRHIAMASAGDAAPGGLKIVLVVAAALIDESGRVMLTQRPEGKHMGGLWEFPGGKVDGGEAPEPALARELMEELDIRVNPADLKPLTFASHTYETFHLLMPLYAVRRWEGTPRGAEGQNLAWVEAGELGGYDMPPADVPLIAPVLAAMADGSP